MKLFRALVISLVSASLMAAGLQAADSDALDLSQRPFVIFHPAPPRPADQPDIPLPDGAVDYFDLFDPDAPWKDAASRIDVFAVHSWFVRHYATDEQLLAMIADLEERGIALGLEMEPLEHPDPTRCAQTESFEGRFDLAQAQRLKDLGATVALVSLDEPYSHAHKLDGPGSCQYPVARVVDEVAVFLDQLRAIYPDVVVGSIEPAWGDPPITASDMATWLDTFEQRTGAPFAFLNIDVDWERPDWQAAVREIELVADERGVPFGILYLGNGSDQTNDDWLRQNAEHFASYEQEWGGTPDIVGFYSWHDQPDQLLPDGDVHTYTGLINQYFGARTTLEAPIGRGKQDGPGRLASVDGGPLANRRISVTALPLGATTQRHALQGIVPEGASRGQILVRANTEGGQPAPVDVRIRDVRYREGGDGPNKVANPRFRRGLDSWGAYGDGTARPRATRGGGQALALRAKPSQPLYVDSDFFAVTPGQPFEFAATMAVAGDSVGSGYVAVAFIADDEIARSELWFEARPIELEPTITNAAGEYRLDSARLAPGAYAVRVQYDGDQDHWPAGATTTVVVR